MGTFLQEGERSGAAAWVAGLEWTEEPAWEGREHPGCMEQLWWKQEGGMEGEDGTPPQGLEAAPCCHGNPGLFCAWPVVEGQSEKGPQTLGSAEWAVDWEGAGAPQLP